MNPVVKLMKVNGALCLPESPEAIKALGEFFGAGPYLLLARYPAGDCDVIKNVRGEKNRENLRSALYDAREMGVLPSNCRSVALPCGKVFEID